MTFLPGPRLIVVDASSAVEMLDGAEAWVRRFADWVAGDTQLLAPGHFRLEVANALHKGQRRDPLLVVDGVRRVMDAGIASARDHPDALADIISLASRHRLTVYDAAYLQLALELEGELATSDKALARAARAEGLTVHS